MVCFNLDEAHIELVRQVGVGEVLVQLVVVKSHLTSCHYPDLLPRKGPVYAEVAPPLGNPKLALNEPLVI